MITKEPNGLLESCLVKTNNHIKKFQYMYITVFTPSYNRANLLFRLYQSLVNQTYKNFEWLIIDDGSKDQTEGVVDSFIKENKIVIRYFKMPNGGKHRAINKGVEMAKGELFYIVDSDDFLTEDSVEKIAFYANSIKDNDCFCGVAGLRCYPDGKNIAVKKEFSVIDSDDIKISKYLDGDRAQAYFTKCLKEFPFPEFENETFISESIVWYRMAQKYKVRFFFDAIYITEYLQDGLTKNVRRLHRINPKGSLLLYKERVDYAYLIKDKVKGAINYWRSTIGYKGKKDKSMRIVWWGYMFYPIGWLFYKLDY